MTQPRPYTDADIEMVAAATEQHSVEDERTDVDGNSPCSCNLWWDSPADASWDEHMADVALRALADAGRLLPPDRIADAALVRHAAEADIARQVLILAEDTKILAMWADTCDPRPVTVADHFRALAEKLARPTAAEVKP